MHMSAVPPLDKDVLELIIHRDVDALAELYDRYAPRVFNLVYRIVKDTTVAEGLVQDVFLQIWDKAHTYNMSGSMGAWICRIARNKALDHLRRVRVRPSVIHTAIEDLCWVNTALATTSPEYYVEQQIHHNHLESALLQLPREQEHCIRLSYFEGMSHGEIANYTHTPLGTVKTRIRSGLSKLALLLRRHGYTSYEQVS